MPKSRKRAIAKGAKSTAIRTKFKIGTRKSSQGAKQTSTKEITEMLGRVRKRDRNMLRDILATREIS